MAQIRSFERLIRREFHIFRRVSQIMWLLAFSGWILLLNHVLASDTTSQQNDIIPDQALQIPYGMFCYFTMSELMFRDQMQQVASSAYRVGAGRLSVSMENIRTSRNLANWQINS